LIEILWQ